MKKKKFKGILSLLIVLTMLISTATPAFAMSMGDKSSITKTWLSEFGKYRIDVPGNWKEGQMEMLTAAADGTPVYCLEFWQSANNNDTTAMNVRDTQAWRNMSYTAQRGITRASLYGYPNSTFGVSPRAAYAATQSVMWEYELGSRVSDVGDSIFASYISKSGELRTAYNALLNAMQNHGNTPSFHRATVELQGIGANFAQTLTDTNNIINNMDITCNNPNVSVSVSGNQMSIYTTGAFDGTATLTAIKNGTDRGTNSALCLTGANQTMLYGAISDPVFIEVYIEVAAGAIKIIKTAEDGDVAGKQFHIVGDGIDTVITTGVDGTVALSDLSEGTYTISEINIESRYVTPANQTVTVQRGQTATVNFENKLKRGNAEFKKSDLETHKEIETKDGVFGIYEWNKGAGTYNRKGAMSYNNDKAAYDTGKLIYTVENDGWFKITEEQAPTGYVLPTNLSYEFKLTEDGEIHRLGTDGVVVNAPQKGKIHISKTDDETDKALENAVYTIIAAEDVIFNGDIKYKKNEVVDTITTDKKGQAESKELYLGKYLLYEEKAPDFYVLNPEVYNITLDYQGQTVDVFVYDIAPTNKPQKGKFEVTKQGEVLIGFDFMGTELGVKHTPIYEVQNLANATYEIYANEDVILNGDVKYAKGEVVDTITTGKNGVAISKELYLGAYRIVETIAPEGFFIGSNEYEVSLTYQGQDIEVFSVSVLSENERQHIKTRLKKTIEENTYYPNPEAYQDIVFGIFNDEEIKDSEGNVLLEKDSLVDCFGIDKDGQGLSVTDLPFAKYHIEELQTAEGYVLNKNHYPFEFKPQDQTIPLLWIDLNENGTAIDNETIKGRVHIKKTSSFDGRSLPGAVYGIFRASDDELLMTLKTETNEFDGSAGATSELLPYGEYYLKEITPANHYHLDPTEYLFFIGKRGEETITLNFDLMDEPIIGALAPFYNEKGLKEYLDGSLMPQTGDNSYLNLALGGAAISGFVVLALVIKRSRKRRKRSDN